MSIKGWNETPGTNKKHSHTFQANEFDQTDRSAWRHMQCDLKKNGGAR